MPNAIATPTPRLVLMPGLDGTGRLFSRLIAAAPAGLPITALTYPERGPQTYEGLQRAVAAQLPVGERYMLVAESFSGPLALRIAAHHPPGLRAIVLVSSFVASPLSPAHTLWAAALGPVALRMTPPAALVRRFMVGEDADDALVEDVREAIRATHPRVKQARLRQVLIANEAIAYLRTHLPMFCLAARQDRLLGGRSVERLIRLRPGLQLTELDGPHLLLQSRPEACIRILQSIAERSRFGH